MKTRPISVLSLCGAIALASCTPTTSYSDNSDIYTYALFGLLATAAIVGATSSDYVPYTPSSASSSSSRSTSTSTSSSSPLPGIVTINLDLGTVITPSASYPCEFMVGRSDLATVNSGGTFYGTVRVWIEESTFVSTDFDRPDGCFARFKTELTNYVGPDTCLHASYSLNDRYMGLGRPSVYLETSTEDWGGSGIAVVGGTHLNVSARLSVGRADTSCYQP